MLTGMDITRAARSTSASSARTSTGARRHKHAIQDRRYGSIRTDAWFQSCVEIDATLTSELYIKRMLVSSKCFQHSHLKLFIFSPPTCGRGPANARAWPIRGAAGKRRAICGWKRAGRGQKNNPKHPKTPFSCEIWVSVFVPDLSVLGFLVVVKIFEISQ